MKKTLKHIIIVTLMVLSTATRAQNEGVITSLLPQLPYSNFFNPGIRVPYKGLIGLGVSNVNVSMYNSSLKYGDMFGSENGETYLDGIKFFNSLDDDNNQMNTAISLNLLDVGFRTGRFFFNIDVRVKVDENVTYSKDFVGLFLLGNGNYLGADNPVRFNVGLESTAYTEVGLGIQYDFGKHLTVGVRPRMLFGVMNAKVNSNGTEIYTDPDNYAMSANMNFEMQAASIIKTDMATIRDVVDMVDVFSMDVSSLLDMISIKDNIGFGVDFGASYVFNRHFGIAAGVRDLGFIKWNDTKVKSNSGSVESVSVFDNVLDVVDFEFDYKSMLDEIVDNVWGNDTLSDGGTYTTKLNTNVNMQVYYEFHPTVRFTAIGQMRKIQDEMKTSFTFAYSGSFGRFVNLAANYTISKQFGNSLGAGLSLHFGPVNFYAVTDNILILSNIGKSALEIATAYNTMSVRAGVVISLGRFQKTSDRMAGI